jgi:hypothetical protein
MMWMKVGIGIIIGSGPEDRLHSGDEMGFGLKIFPSSWGKYGCVNGNMEHSLYTGIHAVYTDCQLKINYQYANN